MKYLLDTHALIWCLEADNQLSVTAREVISASPYPHLPKILINQRDDQKAIYLILLCFYELWVRVSSRDSLNAPSLSAFLLNRTLILIHSFQ